MPDITVTGQALIQQPLSIGSGTKAIIDFLAASHLGFTNLEVAGKALGAWPTKTKTVHWTTRQAVASLRELGFTALGHANNHSFDLGPPGIAAIGPSSRNDAGAERLFHIDPVIKRQETHHARKNGRSGVFRALCPGASQP